MVKNTKKISKCSVVKPLQPKISNKNLNILKTYLECANTKCKHFLEKDIKISQKCLDKTSHLKLFNLEQLRCYDKSGLYTNTIDKINCLKTKCKKQLSKYNTIPHNQKTIDASEFSFFDKEKKRFTEKLEKIYPELAKLTKIMNDIDLIRLTLSKCKDESEIKKLKYKINRLNKMYDKIDDATS
jgi:hypothetical protein